MKYAIDKAGSQIRAEAGAPDQADRNGTIHKAYVVNDQGAFVPYKK